MRRNKVYIVFIFLIFFISTQTAFALGPGNVSSGLTLWLDASTSTYSDGACTAAATNGQTIGCWQDQSGNNRHANSTTNTPTLVTNSINGNPFIAFDKPNTSSNTGDMINLTGVNLSDVITTSAYSLVYVGSIDTGYAFTGGQEPMIIRDSTADPSSKWNLQPADSFSPRLAINHTAASGYTNPYTSMRDSLGNLTFGWPVMFSSTFTTGTKANVMTGATNVSGATPGNITSVTGGVMLGSEANNTRYDFNIAELLVFNRTITATERQQVESHLAIKYGLTLASHTNFVQHTNYLDTTGAIIWNGFVAGTEFSYHSDITALGRHDASGLNHTSSKSVNTTSILSLSNPTNLDSGEYFFVGRDDPGTYTSPVVPTFTSTGAPTGAQILTRKWRARETGSVGVVKFAFDVEDPQFDIPAAIGGTYYLISDTDGDNLLTDESSFELFDDGTNGDVLAGDNIWTIEKDIGTGIFTIASETVNFQGTVYTDEGVTNIGAGKTVRMLVGGTSAVTAVTDASGNFSITRGIPAAGDILTFHIDGATEDAVTVTRFDGTTLTGYDLYQNRLIVRTENGTALSNTDLDTAHDADADITSIYTNGLTTTLTVANSKELFIWAGDTFTPGGTVNIGSTTAGAGSLDINGTLDAGSNAINLRGSLDVDNSGTFTHTGTLTMNSTSASTYNQGDDPILSTLVANNSVGITAQVNPVNVANLTITTTYLDINAQNLTVSGTFSNNATLRLVGSEATTLTQDIDSGTWYYKGDGDALADTYTIKDFGATDYFGLQVLSTDTLDSYDIGLALNTASSFNLQGGIVNTNNNNVTVGTFYQQNGTLASTFNAGSSTFAIGTSFTLGATGGALQPVVFNAGSSTMTTGTTFSQTGTSPSITTFNASTGSLTVGTNFSKSGTGSTFNGSSGTMAVNGNFTSSSGGPFFAPTSTLTLGGNLTTTSSGGVYNANGGSVILTPNTNHTFAGSVITFNNLTLLDTGLNNIDSILTLGSATTYTITGTLTLDGFDADDRVNIVSAAPGTATSFSFTGTATFSGNFLDITDNYVTDSSTALTAPINPTNSIDGGNTLNWFGTVVEFTSITAASTNETTADNFPVLLVSGILASSATVEVDINGGGTATSGGVDYTSADPIVITIPAGTYDGTVGTAIVITVPTLVQDFLIEGNETITFTLQNPSGVSVGDASGNSTSESFHTYTITDDDVAVSVEFSAATAASTNESSANNFPVLLVNGTLASSATIDVDITGGTATGGGTDYASSDPITVTIPAGTYDGLIGTAVAITVPTLVQDSIVESGGETVTFSLTNPSGVAAGDANGNTTTQSTHTYTITDDDTLLVEFTSQALSSSEATATPTWTLTVGGAIISSSASVQVANAGTGSATSGGTDFTFASPTTITIPAGDYTTASTITITGLTIVEDLLIEGSETIDVILQGASGVSLGDADANATNESTATFTITDNDTAGVTVELSSATAASTNEATANNFPTLLVTGTLITARTIDLDITGGTATGSGTDYTMTDPLTITIPAGTYDGTIATDIVITVPTLIQDSIQEIGGETIIYSLTNPSTEVTVGDADSNTTTQSTHSYTITDDDTLLVEFTTQAPNAGEATASPTWTLTVSGAIMSSSASVQVANLGTGSATSGGTDFTFASPVTITIPAGDYTTANTVSISGLTIIQDIISEVGGETINFQLQSASNVTLGDADANATNESTATFTITDDDTPAVTVTEVGGSTGITEGGVTDTYTIALTTTPSSNVTITLTPDADCTVSPAGPLVFSSTAAQTITVTAVDDAFIEGAHTCTITHSAVSADTDYNGIAINSVVANVTDNDTGSVTVELSSATAASTNEATADNFPKILVLGTISATKTISITNAGGTATSFGTDYSFPGPLTVNIPAGTYDGTVGTALSVTVPLLTQDSIQESGGETIGFSLTSPGTDVTIGDANSDATTQSTHTYTITDDDTLLVEFTTQTPSSLESVASPIWTLTVGGATISSSVTVQVVDLGTGSATSGGTDYTFATPITVTIPAGDYTTVSTVAITGLTITEDILAETGGETINFDLQNATGVIEGDSDGNSTNESTTTYTITDNDSPSVVITEIGGSTNIAEGGATDTYTISLATTPNSNVSIALTPSAQCTISPVGPLTFSNTTAQTITVTAVDDGITEGVHTCTITHSAISLDLDYNTIGISNVVASVTDNDTPLLVVGGAPISVQEPDPNTAGVVDTFTLRLATAPTADVTVTVTLSNGYIVLSDGDETLQSTIILTFTPLNYATAQTITVTTVDDLLFNGTRNTNISFAIASADLNYNGLVTTDLSVSVLDGVDEDGDGVNNSIEAANPFNGGDGNGDGTIDANQQSVSGAPNPVTGDYTTLEATGACVFITQNAFISELTLKDAPLLQFPVGLVDFRVECPGPGMSSNIKIYYTETYDISDWSYKKYNSVTTLEYADITPLVTFGTETVGGIPVTTVSFSVTDGDSQTDEDGVIDNFINDPSGPATSITVPTSSGGGSSGGSVLRCRYSNAINYNQLGVCNYPVATPPSSQKVDLIGGGEPNVPAEFSNYVCERYLRSYIMKGTNNNIEEVKKLQKFLNIFEKENLVVDGVYNSNDIEAVKRFQIKYADQILAPWGHSTPTGNVYRTTAAKINIMLCSTQKGCPYFNEYLKEGNQSLEAVKVQDFINIIFAPTSGYPTNGIPLSKTFETKTKNGVSEFQSVYKDIVLKPWGLKSATGWWYKTSRHAANKLLNCNEGEIKLDNGVTFK